MLGIWLTDRGKQPAMKYRLTASVATSLCLLAAVPGCLEEHARPKLDLGVAPQRNPLGASAAFRDTIGAYAYFEGLTPMRVRGYGIVVGLGTNGSRDCPRNVYNRLVQRLYKRHAFSSTTVGVKSITPERLIHDLDTAVVIVEGEIPPAAVRGQSFDIAVAALPGTETKSLRGGHLFTTELEVYRSVTSTVAIMGRALARARGPVFFNPFADETSATATTPLEGTILGGGTVMHDRRIRLVMTEPSYRRVNQIQIRINAHFPGPGRTADAVSPSFIRLRVPPEYAQDTVHFLGLIRHLFLSRDPKFEAPRGQALEEEIKSPTAPHAQIALALEGLGQSALPVLERLYAAPQDWVSFHAAAAGLRLYDHLAVDAMTKHAEDQNCTFRFQAIHALAQAKSMGGAAIVLRRILNDVDPRAQTAAYEGLVARGDPTIQTTTVGDGNFVLDWIPTESGNFVYVKRSGSRRIALFGRDIACRPPIFYRSPDGSIMIDAKENDEKLTLLRRVVATGALSPPIPGPLELPALIQLLGNEAAVGYDKKVTGLGLDYTAISRLLYRLSLDRSINANFILEQPNVAELFGPPSRASRPESESES